MDFGSNKPIYSQIVDYCFGCIMRGEWRAGERVPSVRELAGQMGVNSHTVLKSMDELQQAGIVYPRRGMGFYLAEDAREKVDEARRREFFEDVLPRVFDEMNMLGVDIDAIVEAYKKR